MNTSIPLLAFGLFVLASLVLLHLAGGLVSRKRSTAAVLAELGVLFAFGVALALYLETRKKERPLPRVELAAEGVNADSSRSLHVRAAPGTVLHCSSVFAASFGPDGTPLDAPAECTVRFRADPAPGTAPVAFGADGKAVVTLPAACCDLVPDKAVRVWLDGKDLGITSIPATQSRPETMRLLREAVIPEPIPPPDGTIHMAWLEYKEGGTDPASVHHLREADVDSPDPGVRAFVVDGTNDLAAANVRDERGGDGSIQWKERKMFHLVTGHAESLLYRVVFSAPDADGRSDVRVEATFAVPASTKHGARASLLPFPRERLVIGPLAAGRVPTDANERGWLAVSWGPDEMEWILAPPNPEDVEWERCQWVRRDGETESVHDLGRIEGGCDAADRLLRLVSDWRKFRQIPEMPIIPFDTLRFRRKDGTDGFVGFSPDGAWLRLGTVDDWEYWFEIPEPRRAEITTLVMFLGGLPANATPAPPATQSPAVESHAESAKPKPHAGSAESAELETHAESAETAEP